MARRMSYLLLVMIASCASPSLRLSSNEDDNRINVIKEIILIRRSLDSIQTSDSTIKVELAKKKYAIDSVIDRLLDYKQDRAELQHLHSKMVEITKDKSKIIRQIDSLRIKNELLIKENKYYQSALTDERNNKNLIISQKNKLENDLKEASKLSLTSVNITGLGVNKSLFGKSKDIETNRESKIDRIRASFILPSNSAAKKEPKFISLLVYSATRGTYIQKDTTISYDGTERNIQMVLGGKIFKNGSHVVRIYVNNKIQVEKEFVVIK